MNAAVTLEQKNSYQNMNFLPELQTPSQTNSAQGSTSSNSLTSSNSVSTTQELPQTVVSQPSNLPEQNTVTTLQLNLPDLVQNTEHNKCLMSTFASRLDNTVSKSGNDSTLQSNSLQSTIPQCTPSTTSSTNATQQGQLASHVSCIVPNPNLAGPQMPNLQGGSDSDSSSAVALSRHTEIVNAIMKIKQELYSSANSSAPSTSTPMPSIPGSTQESGNQGAAEGDTLPQSNSNFPPVSIGACLLCGGDCGCEEPDSEEEAERGFLPPPPMVSCCIFLLLFFTVQTGQYRLIGSKQLSIKYLVRVWFPCTFACANDLFDSQYSTT